LVSFTTLKASNIFELFSIFVAAFFPRNVSRADWVAKDGAWASRSDCCQGARTRGVRPVDAVPESCSRMNLFYVLARLLAVCITRSTAIRNVIH
jgi:hypothetical protein